MTQGDTQDTITEFEQMEEIEMNWAEPPQALHVGVFVLYFHTTLAPGNMISTQDIRTHWILVLQSWSYKDWYFFEI